MNGSSLNLDLMRYAFILSLLRVPRTDPQERSFVYQEEPVPLCLVASTLIHALRKDSEEAEQSLTVPFSSWVASNLPQYYHNCADVEIQGVAYGLLPSKSIQIVDFFTSQRRRYCSW
jgi:hypothetical protein